jgi:hypothetical protein
VSRLARVIENSRQSIFIIQRRGFYIRTFNLWTEDCGQFAHEAICCQPIECLLSAKKSTVQRFFAPDLWTVFALS